MKIDNDAMEDNLYIPVNIPDTEDYILGLGYKELVMIGVMILSLVFLCLFMISSSGKMLITLFLGIMLIVLTVLTIRKDIHRENLIKKIRIWHRYIKIQKKYEYHYYNIHEGFCKGEKE